MTEWIFETIATTIGILLVLSVIGSFVAIFILEPMIFYCFATLVAFIIMVGLGRLGVIYFDRHFGDGPAHNPYPWENNE